MLFSLYKWIFVCLLFLSIFSSSCSGDGIQDQPNILLIFVDDLGKEWVSAYGADDIETPHIDQLAETGLMFKNFYVNPQCTPSRMSLFTGQYPFRHGWVNHWDVPRWGGGAHYDWNVNPGLGRAMHEAGYKTASVGKWQVNDFRVQPDAMKNHGFDDWCMWTGFEAGNPSSGERYWDPYLHTREGSRTYEGDFGEDVFTDFLISFMEENKDDPMFLYYAMCLTHTPFVATPAEPDATEKYARHKAMVRYMDLQVGKLVKSLDDLGLRENTIIVFTTDNGTTRSITGSLNGRKVKGGKARMTESGTAVPFIVNCPSMVPMGETTDALGDITDILPTFTELGQADLTEIYTFDGASFADLLLSNSKDSKRDWIMSMGGGNNAALSEKGVENQYRFRDRVLRDKEYKLYVSTDRKPEQLYDLKNDPYETQNLVTSKDPEIQQIIQKLWKVVETFPEVDSDPQYIPLGPQAWDVEVTVESQKWKK
ncbi:MAG: N-acetylgalactosamine 6-sulfate sulfatase [Phycisphaeraceae bacterium]|nr:N-acetylgalactosamine 6-sulfate sulfatase [Phycisphaeraceae bacterium]